MIKVLDLFAGTQSVRKALSEMFGIGHWDTIDYDDNENLIKHWWSGWNGKYVVEYIGIDIYSPEYENLILDLSQDNIVEALKEKLPKGWKPDFIWASPICNKFSRVISGEGGNYYYEVKGDTIIPRENWNIKVQPHMQKYQNEDGWKKAREDAELALKLHINTKEIIDYFNVPFAIENPESAMTKYLYKDYIKNIAHYCAYGFDYKKPTAIYGKTNLNLIKCKGGHKHASLVGGKGSFRPTHWVKGNSTYANRSSVPPLLIKDIISQVLMENK